MMADLLLCSGGDLSQYTERIQSFMSERKISQVLIVLYALPTNKLRESFFDLLHEKDYDKKCGVKFKALHKEKDKVQAINDAECVFVFGGNTFALLDKLQKEGLIQPLKQKISSKMPYIGVSAGSVIAGKTIQTTNDMPIIHPKNLDSLGAISFNLNPHYIDPHEKSVHAGETREERINEFHLISGNGQPVVGIYEGSIISVNGKDTKIVGPLGGVLFEKGKKLRKLSDGASICEFL